MAGFEPLALVSNIPGDGVSKKNTGGCATLSSLPPFMSVMSNTNLNNTDPGAGIFCEGPRSGRCPVVQQRRPGCHLTTAKRKWTKELNVKVMECYFLSNPLDKNGRPVRGYRQRMHRLWKDSGMFDIREQNLCDQARAIQKNEWLSVVELEMIKRKVVEQEEYGLDEPAIDEPPENNGNETNPSELMPNTPAGIVEDENTLRTAKQEEMLIMELMNGNEVSFYPGLKDQ